VVGFFICDMVLLVLTEFRLLQYMVIFATKVGLTACFFSVADHGGGTPRRWFFSLKFPSWLSFFFYL